MSITTVPSAITGQTLSAADWNTQVRDNINGIWVMTAAGDMMYATSASAAARLAKPSVDSILKNTSSGVPSWLALGNIPGGLHTKGKIMTNTLRTSTSTTYANVHSTFKVDLVLTVACTIIAWAHGVAHKDAGSYAGSFALSIDGTTDPDVDNIQVKSTTPTPFGCMYYATGIAAGTRTVRLLFKTGNAGDPVNMDSGAIHAIAIAE